MSPHADAALIACHECDLLQQEPTLQNGEQARCGRCDALLFRQRPETIDRALGLTVAALVLIVLANVYPFMTFSLEGQSQENWIITGVIELYDGGMWLLAGLILFVSVVAPLLWILGMLYVLLPLRLGSTPPALAEVYRFVEAIHPWAMLEVYLLGVMVAIIKLSQMAKISLETGSFAFGALILVLAAATSALDPRAVWARIGNATIRGGAGAAAGMAADSGLASCHACAALADIRAPGMGSKPVCPRCGAALHLRKPNSLARTWALVIAAIVLYIPANLYPILILESLGKDEGDTILSGIKELFAAGMLPIALLIFFASITVPMLKLCGLTYLLLSVHFRSLWRPKDRTTLYRILETIGRWSMIDMFMVSILVALVQLGPVATILPGIGATAFAAVVVTTMFAASAFDPRLIWDVLEEEA